ncbi:hypothetical protein [Staphylococcus succinus]|uniref:hypothetical protein n=1 Tax=Staphylococcus succinus TaxID=61015 RepID=UPI000E67C071|nr:hypothetical protein [Staphylococcus succinus]RIN39743.1 hypothetical protein BU059_12480 [Staphylococcus succinus]
MECIEDILCENGVKKLLTVPCTILSKYFYKNTIETIYLSKEEEGVGIASGLTIAKEKPVMIIQNSGLGNCINAFASLCNPYKIGFLVIVSMRGDELEDNPVQIPMGNATKTFIFDTNPLNIKLRCHFLLHKVSLINCKNPSAITEGFL